MAAVVPFVPLIAAGVSVIGSALLAPSIDMPQYTPPPPPSLPPPPEPATMPELPAVLQPTTPASDTTSAITAEQDRQKNVRRQAANLNQAGLLESNSTVKKTLLGE